MKKIFHLLFLTILIAKAFPDEREKDEKIHRFSLSFPIHEIATAEFGIDAIWGGDSSSYWKANLLNMHFLLWDRKIDEDIIDFEITPLIISKNKDISLYNLSFAKLRISYILYNRWFVFDLKPFLEINYLFLKDKVFDFNTINFHAGFRFGILPMFAVKDLFYIEAGYAYKNNRNNYFISIGISPFWGVFPFPTV